MNLEAWSGVAQRNRRISPMDLWIPWGTFGDEAGKDWGLTVNNLGTTMWENDHDVRFIRHNAIHGVCAEISHAA
jgi:hypothetical protein